MIINHLLGTFTHNRILPLAYWKPLFSKQLIYYSDPTRSSVDCVIGIFVVTLCLYLMLCNSFLTVSWDISFPQMLLNRFESFLRIDIFRFWLCQAYKKQKSFAPTNMFFLLQTSSEHQHFGVIFPVLEK